MAKKENYYKALRKAKGLTQTDVAEAVGVSKSMISQHETGRFKLSKQKEELYKQFIDNAKTGKDGELLERKIVQIDVRKFRLEEPQIKRRVRMIEWMVTDTECWECTSHSRSESGYPQACRAGVSNGNNTAISRIMYTYFKESIKDGLLIRHKCDNPACINPDHLETGTALDNARDRQERGRSANGTKHPNSVLTEDEVRDIKHMFHDGARNVDVERKYKKVSRTTISRIKNGSMWGHITID
jgi:transcriptional regulator with XRE-family HTH domain